ncbi:UvrD-helicase domain-containing protein, partial [Bacillus safensis]|uniref:UvrD-helicase domain-containing protein n=1 Tax=Bacillus safensis TaxID=561879 RepID=UPI0030008F16
MRIIVAGAGAGKTTSMAEEVLNRYEGIKDGKIIYVITYTNAARDHIRKKIIELHGSIPKQIKVETSHVFLLQEIIFPFNYLLYGQLYTTSSVIALPSNRIYRANKLKELREQNIIHVEEVTEIAKYVLVGKSSDKKMVKEKRKIVLVTIGRYLDSVFIDEVQDIDSNLSEIIEILHNNDFNLHLVGDPKQDLRGRNELRKLLEKYSQYVEYKRENYRCPISHVNFSNKYVIEEERQDYQTTDLGTIE